METYRKQASAEAIASEAAGLRWLAAAGGAGVAELVAVGDTWLETRLMRPGNPSREDAAEFGRRVAATHAAGAGWWGAAPPDADPTAQRLAELPAPMASAPRYASFGEFLAHARLGPYLRAASVLDDAERRVLARAVDRIADGAHDSPQPLLVQRSGQEAARIHGDLWGGNVVWERVAGGTVGTLIDPAAHGGHAESDLAELQVFGSPHLDATLAAYDEVSPLADGWRERVAAHQLHMLLVHVVLFGRSYAGQAVDIARKL